MGELDLNEANPQGLSGEDVKRMIQGAAGWVALHREALNLINVYPVPDGDTGANLGRTLAAASEALEATDHETPAHEMATVAALSGIAGRDVGSSGVIGAQWFAWGLRTGLWRDSDDSLVIAFNNAAARRPAMQCRSLAKAQ